MGQGVGESAARVLDVLSDDDVSQVYAAFGISFSSRLGWGASGWESAGVREDFRCWREATGFLLMLEAGLRVGELCALSLECVFVGEEVADRVNVPASVAKTGYGRMVPISGPLYALLAYFKRRRVFYAGLGVTGLWRFGGDHVLSRGRRAWQSWIKSFGHGRLNRRLWPHVLRHTFATRVLRVSNLRVTQTLLGHRRVSSTQCYTHPSMDDLTRAVYRSCGSPMVRSEGCSLRVMILDPAELEAMSKEGLGCGE